MSRGSAQGFTLVELLVALALLGLMTAYAVAALGSLKDVSRVSAKMEAQAEIDAVTRHLRQSIADTRAVFVNAEDGAAEIVFSGGPRRLEVVSVLNDRLERGGLYVLGYGANEQGRSLTLKRRLYRPQPDSDSTPPATEDSLLEGVESVMFRYCEANCARVPKDWSESWEVPDRLPGFIRITVKFPKNDSRRWPELVVPLAGAF